MSVTSSATRMHCRAAAADLCEFHGEPLGAQIASELLLKQELNVRLIVHHQNKKGHTSSGLGN